MVTEGLRDGLEDFFAIIINVHVYIGRQTVATLCVTIRQSGGLQLIARPSRQLTDSVEVVAVVAPVSDPEKVEVC